MRRVLQRAVSLSSREINTTTPSNLHHLSTTHCATIPLTATLRNQHTETATPSKPTPPSTSSTPPSSPTTNTPSDNFLHDAASCSKGPLAAYRDLRLNRKVRKDARQEATTLQLQRLYDDLNGSYGAPDRRSSGLTMMDAAGRSPNVEVKKHSWWREILSGGQNEKDERAARNVPDIMGLYMYGGVGVGKTMLMDMFAETAPPSFKLERTHYHDFMIEVHTKLRNHQKTADPLTFVADDIANRIQVLCLDELFVTDVADAMILHRLFERLWDRGLVLVGTSNRHPDTLYEGGLQRSLFLPFIERLKTACHIHDMSSTVDYRRLAQHQGGLYFVTPTREEDLYARFIELANNNPVQSVKVPVAMGRFLEMPRVGGCIAIFDFEELCERPLGAADYIALAEAKHTIALSGVPVFTAANRSAAYRFVTLVDVFYEHRIRLLCSAEAMPFDLFSNVKTHEQAKADHSPKVVVDDNLGFSKDRTVSRLIEMQSEEYLIAHAKLHAPELLLALEEQAKHKKVSLASLGC